MITTKNVLGIAMTKTWVVNSLVLERNFMCNTHYISFVGIIKPYYKKGWGEGGNKHFRDILKPPWEELATSY